MILIQKSNFRVQHHQDPNTTSSSPFCTHHHYHIIMIIMESRQPSAQSTMIIIIIIIIVTNVTNVILMIIMESRQPNPKSTQVITIDISVNIIMESHTPQFSSSSNLLVLRPALQIFSAIQQSNTKLELPGLGDFSKNSNACIWTKVTTVFFFKST